MKKVLISTTEDEHKYGFKARYDIIDILKKTGYDEIMINTNHVQSFGNLLYDLFKSYKSLKNILKSLSNSIVVIQYPWNSLSLKYAKCIKKYSIKNNLKSVVIVHDLNIYRTKNIFGKLSTSSIVCLYNNGIIACIKSIIHPTSIT